MRILLINPSDVAFGVGVITPRWLYVLAAPRPSATAIPSITDETLERSRLRTRIHRATSSGSASTPPTRSAAGARRSSRERGAWVVYGGIHATLYPDEAREIGRTRTPSSRATATWSGATCWTIATAARPSRVYEGGQIGGRALRRGPLGPASRRTATCGPRCRPSADARSTVPSAPSGAPTASSRGRARSTP